MKNLETGKYFCHEDFRGISDFIRCKKIYGGNIFAGRGHDIKYKTPGINAIRRQSIFIDS